MRLFKGLAAWPFQRARKSPHRDSQLETRSLRRCHFETMEQRCLLNADPIFVGAVYIEDDSGSDIAGDTFEITFRGGAAGTELKRFIIDGDKDKGATAPAPGEIRAVVNGDVFFDTVEQDPTDPNGLGQLNAIPLSIVSKVGDFGVSWSVADGTTRLVFDFTGFTAGEKLVFRIDVDEANDLSFKGFDGKDPNAGVDSIASGNEFQGSHIRAEFVAPHFFDAAVQTIFIDRYNIELQAVAGLPAGHPAATANLDLSPDDVAGKINRTAGGAGAAVQVPKPISISGRVFHDRDLDLTQDAGDEGIAGVTLSLWRKNSSGVYQQVVGSNNVPITTVTNQLGDYEFGFALNLPPGVYQVREVQPAAFPISVGAAPGSLAPGGATVGTAQGTNILTEISIPLGDTQAVDYDFAEAKFAQLSGFVYHDRDNDGVREPASGEEGIAGVRVAVLNQQGVEVAHTFTQPDGSYAFTTLRPGVYTVVEQHPAEWIDGLDRAGSVQRQAGGSTTTLLVGSALNPGDTIGQVSLISDDRGVNYNFGERLGSIAGFVHADPDGDCVFDPGEAPIAGVTMLLLNSQGQVVQTQVTDQQGRYHFADLHVGTYTVVQQQPSGYLNGGQVAGVTQTGALGGGNTATANRISGIQIGAGQNVHLTQYNFCERLGSISGYVYHDRDNDGVREPNGNQQGAVEEGIAGVTVTLYNAQGAVARDANGNLLITRTDSQGFYEFKNLSPGVYRIVETHPAAWIDGIDTPGTFGGQTVGAAQAPDELRNVTLSDANGGAGVNYNFGERLGSLQGFVHSDPDGDCLFDEDEAPLDGVLITLLDANGNVVDQQLTDANGRYLFKDLQAGRYSVVQQQPDDYFTAGQVAGVPGNGDASAANVISGISIDGNAINLADYNFCEQRGSLSGYVYHDRDNDGLREVGGNQFGEIEEGIAGVTVLLYNAQGQPVVDSSGVPISAVTDANGFYKFTDLAPGAYRIVEVHPQGWIDGIDTPGTINGVTSGQSTEPDTLRQINLTAANPGQTAKHGVNYNFGEFRGASIEGFVHVDMDGDCIFDEDEAPIAGVLITLIDQHGAIRTTTTDQNGHYRFDNLPPGVYTVIEQQPAGFFHGGQTAGAAGNGDDSQDDVISQILIRSEDVLVEYNFCEIPPASIAGVVHVDPDGDCVFDEGETPLAGVTITLTDEHGNVQTTTTDAIGRYKFDNLRPGLYTVFEVQPGGYFHGGQVAGQPGNGDASQADLISGVTLAAGDELIDYNFCEVPPAIISGFVFQDGAAITTIDGTPPANMFTVRDGRRTSDDTPIAGVVLELRNVLGQPITADRALAGVYAPGPIRVVTDANGFYEFKGLRAGSYSVFQVHPDGYIDSIDTAGAINSVTSGFPVNANQFIDDLGFQQAVSRLSVDSATNPSNDAILLINLGAGQQSVENNFSEVRVTTLPPPPQPPEPPFLPPPPPLIAIPPAQLAPPPFFLPPQGAPPFFGSGDIDYTWHLSVVDAGAPRGDAVAANPTATVWMTSTLLDHSDWTDLRLRDGRWRIPLRDSLFTGAEENDGDESPLDQPLAEYLFGISGAIAVSGDFNGDGVAEIGLFYRGEWFIDVNGNGVWDDDDLWARLGSDADLPVTGDWDGDGKDDIGIFGPMWPGDPRAIEAEPGLPDPYNTPKDRPKNVPPKPEDATDGRRVLKRGEQGRQRSDLIDHVFHYGGGAELPVAGDWNGDGIDAIGVFKDGRWRLDLDGDGRWGQGDVEAHFGAAGDTPVVGDFDGDGVDEIGVFRDGKWILDTNGNREIDAHDRVFALGGAGDQPVINDFNGDGIDEPGLYRDIDPNVARRQ